MGIQPETLASASGLRPLSAFVVVAVVVLGVVAQVGRLTLFQNRPIGEHPRVESGWQPSYSIEDEAGRTLARFVSRYGLEMSPRSMWQAHTPAHMAEVLSEALGGEPSPAEMLELIVPDAEAGVVRASAWELSPLEAERVARWIDRGGARGEDDARPPLRGIGVEPIPGGQDRLRYRVAWMPEIVLSQESREDGGYPPDRPLAWSRHLAQGLAEALPGRVEAELVELRRERPDATSRELTIDVVWRALMPSAWCRLPIDVGPREERRLSEVLAREGVNRLQMQVQVDRERAYPLGQDDLLGDWGFRGPADTERHPRSGLESLCDDVLLELAAPEVERSRYAYLSNRPGGRGRARRSYFLDAEQSGHPPAVKVTLDHELSLVVRRELERLMEENAPVLAMAIVVDVESGDVLAVDGVHGYGLPGFLPTYYQFTPGSTYKIVTAAVALETEVARPETTFDVGRGTWAVPGSSRVIHEAEGTRDGVLSLRECVAFSSNRGMVQVGLRIPQDAWWDVMCGLRYGTAPVTGLGPASPGYAMRPPWKPAWDQASFAFGHQMMTTLWQHAAALTAVIRGGEWKPLGLVDAVRFGDELVPYPRSAGERVLSERTCLEVRDMMELGAFQGTGRDLYRPELAMGTKTGTAEKVGRELCAHRDAAFIRANERSPTKPERTGLVARGASHKGSCYTSSICVFGSLPEKRERELFVLVVVDEPVKNGKYGGKVAGPAALAILDEALGVTRSGRAPVAPVLAGFAPMEASPLEPPDAEPWRARDAEARR